MPRNIVSDASCFILLDKIGGLYLLQKLYGMVITTPEVLAEFGLPLPSWVDVKSPLDKEFQASIEAVLDKGEASTIALAMEHEQCLLIIDELKGRKLASQLGLEVIGTLGLLADAKAAGYIPLIKPILLKIRQTNFRLSDELERVILTKAGE